MRSSYSLRSVLWLVLLVILGGAGALLAWQGLYFCVVFVGLAAAGVIYKVCQAEERQLRMMRRMVQGIRHTDLAFSFPTRSRSRSHLKLAQELNEALSHLRGRISEKEEQFQLYESLLGALDSSLLAVTEAGVVEWMNPAAMRDLTGERIRRIDELASLSPEFPVLLREILPGQVKTIHLPQGEVNRVFIVTITGYHSKGRELRLVNLRNIYSLLDKQEFESWQKLIRVLTHEIMNSIAPIISLAETLCDRLQEQPSADSIQAQALQTIHRRSKGLLEFVESYRRLTRLNMPLLCPVKVEEVFVDLQCLFPESTVRYVYHAEQPLPILMADRTQLEQVLINLIKNATEACTGMPGAEVRVTASYSTMSHILSLTVADNGTGIPAEALDRVFVPFFTTKPGGSGIGLTLCKQIMTLHGGSITVQSHEGEGSSFTLRFILPETPPKGDVSIHTVGASTPRLPRNHGSADFSGGW